MDGAAFALEMHLVHYKAELEDISSAVAEGNQDSLAVLGFLFQVVNFFLRLCNVQKIDLNLANVAKVTYYSSRVFAK